MRGSSSSKRRKTECSCAMKNNKYKATWPPNELPVELFALIIDNLPRSQIQVMRLVNKEFEQKVAQVLFRAVVVPFSPEIYGISSDNLAANDVQSAIMLQDKGMRVFQGFGSWIQKFAMSFEIDMNKLASPPIKSDQEAITSFWGIYRWPFKSYNRYTQLEGLEQTADETRSMAKALKYITNAKELGLSIDGGLGWLAGPDTNSRVVARAEKLSVFGPSRFVKEPKLRASRQHGPIGHRLEAQSSSTWLPLKRILEEAGYRGELLNLALRVLLENEGVVSQNDEDSGLETFQAPVGNPTTNLFKNRLPNRGTGIDFTPIHMDTFISDDDAEHEDDEDDEDDEQEARILSSSPVSSQYLCKHNSEGCPLRPNDLSNAQREMLLEMEWAQNAFMQSWAIAVIDNKDTFEKIETLNIARLPHRHLVNLCRHDFWESMGNLQKLSLAIIPDWREVKKEATSWVRDCRVSPSQSLPRVHNLLTEFISIRRNIKTLHFEWLCGGEYAPGLFARNKLILAAPVVSRAIDMVDRSLLCAVLPLPHVEHLSLKNCWFSPHILKRSLFPLAYTTLKSLSLDSVSLTAPIPLNAQPSATNQAVVVQHLLEPQNHGGLALVPGNPTWLAPPPGALNPAGHLAALQQHIFQQHIQQQAGQALPNLDDWFLVPRSGSWADVIETLTPSTTLATIRYERDLCPQPKPREPRTLNRLAFTSCGYVRVALDFDQSIIEPPTAIHHISSSSRRSHEIESYMMKPLEPTLATVVNAMSSIERASLENAWDLTFGWSKNSELLMDAQLDGILHAGQGRFSGVIEAPQPTPSRLY